MSTPPLWMIVVWAIPVACAFVFIILRYRHNDQVRLHNDGIAQIHRECRRDAEKIFRDG